MKLSEERIEGREGEGKRREGGERRKGERGGGEERREGRYLGETWIFEKGCLGRGGARLWRGYACTVTALRQLPRVFG